MHLVHRAVPPPAAETASPFLTFVAGARAAHVATVFPAPHTPYFSAPTARRHLIHVVLDAVDAHVLADPARRAQLAHDLEFAAADIVAARWLGGAPPGLLKALARIGEAPWTPAQYGALRDLLADAASRLVLRSLTEVTPGTVAMLAALPGPVRTLAVLRRLATLEDAQLLAEAYAAVVWRFGAPAGQVVGRWGRAPSDGRLFEMAAQTVQPEAFVLHLYPEHPDLLRLETRRALEQAALQFRNCLATYVMEAGSGQTAIYSWAGPPVAAVQIVRDAVYGWRLEQVRGQGNEVLAAEARIRLRAALREVGVWCGRPGDDLVTALFARSNGAAARIAQAHAADLAFDW